MGRVGIAADRASTPIRRDGRLLALLISVGLHAGLLALATTHHSGTASRPDSREAVKTVVHLEVLPPPPGQTPPVTADQPVRAAPEQAAGSGIHVPQAAAAPEPEARRPARMEAPPAPTAQDWALAAGYTLKNSKRYRYTWGQQVRSMMGAAVEGPDQGAVRFRVEIAPDGTVARVDTLWTTSDVAERLARRAIANMPPLPPTPTGRPLVFEKTILFDPFASDAPPIYANDCLPDPPAFRNPFGWDGKSPQVHAGPRPAEQPDPQALEECLKQLPQDSIEAESAHDRRQLERWGSSRLGR